MKRGGGELEVEMERRAKANGVAKLWGIYGELLEFLKHKVMESCATSLMDSESDEILATSPHLVAAYGAML